MKNFYTRLLQVIQKFTSLILFVINSSIIVSAQPTWTYLPNSPFTPDRFDDIYFVTDSLGWAVNSVGKIYRTTDAGNNWDLQLSVNDYFRSVEFLNKDTGFAGTLNSRFYKTVDGGENWYNIIDSLPIQVDGICGMSHSGNTVYACGIWSSPAYVLKSTDAGHSWTIESMTDFADALVDCYFLSADTGFVSGSANSLYGHGIILKTVDGGNTWQPKVATDIGDYVWKLFFVNKNLAYASIEDFSFSDSSSILKSTNGGETWHRLTVTEDNIDMEGIGFLNDTLGWCGGWSNGLWQTTDGGQSWSHLNIGSNFNRFFWRSPKLMYASGYGIYMYQGEDIATTTGNILSENPLPHQLLPNEPNPFSSSTIIPYVLDQNTRVRIELFDTKGMRVLDEKLGYIDKGAHQYTLNASKLSSGEYLFVLKTNERTMSMKILCERVE